MHALLPWASRNFRRLLLVPCGQWSVDVWLCARLRRAAENCSCYAHKWSDITCTPMKLLCKLTYRCMSAKRLSSKGGRGGGGGGGVSLLLTAIGYTRISVWIGNYTHVRQRDVIIHPSYALVKPPFQLRYRWVITSHRNNGCNYFILPKDKSNCLSETDRFY